MESKKIDKNKMIMIIGLLLLAAALIITGWNLWRQYAAGKASAEVLSELENIDEGWPDPPAYKLNPNMDMPVRTINGIDYVGTLEIPALKLKLPVINEWSYFGLRFAPCRFTGTPYLNNFILVAHNFSTHFGRIKSLNRGDELYFTDIDGNKFTYEMVDIEILEPTMVKELQAGEWDMTLVTCTLGGSTRVTVRCDLTAEGL